MTSFATEEGEMNDKMLIGTKCAHRLVHGCLLKYGLKRLGHGKVLVFCVESIGRLQALTRHLHESME